LHAGAASRAPGPPAGLVHAPIRFTDALEAARDEYFLPGTEQAVFAQAGPPPRATGASARIASPAPGTIVALDPDIPPQRQRLHFVAEGTGPLRWQLDGRDFGHGTRVQWLPWPGRHTVRLLDARGQALDELRFEVRGAGVRAAKPAPH
ncbi:MAG TPA: penicillin-binding protein 1C, partial [Ramlibacter sp.]|nr:penicillin-binding protein 1C [Ramlibacter sp.]